MSSQHQPEHYPHPDRTPGTGRVLVVDDNSINRMVLREMLLQEGYSVCTATNGAEAVEVFAAEAVDFVLMDVMMPVMDGYAATQRIKALCTERGSYCPVLFVTAITDEKSLAACVECGGDDFLVKPYNRAILRAKMTSLERTRDLYALAQRQRDTLATQNDYLAHEHEIAERTLSKLMQAGYAGARNLRQLLTSVGLVSGDLLLAEYRPDGVQHVLLGDFTGHGLAAAMAAIPVADIFQSMTRKGLGIDLIATEINRKLKAKLPVGLFLAGCLLAVDAASMRVRVWNGGIPDVLFRRAGAGVCARIPSRHLPLGILDEARFDAALDSVEVHQGDCIYVYSDGLIEAVDATDTMFGTERLEALLDDPEADDCFAATCDALSTFRQGTPQHDDITLLEIECPVARTASAGDASAEAVTPGFSLNIEYSAAALRNDDTAAHLERILDMLPVVRAHRGRLYTVVSELYNNALEHGLLRLDSGLKHDTEGFHEYYRLRDQRLRSLEQGSIRVALSLQGDAVAGEVCIEVEDSGAGFEHAAYPLPMSPQSLSRRGLALVRSLCRCVEVQDRGNRVRAVYAWSEAGVA
ncbi:MAG: fused response regulator/phosphatase [Gammaproteobacteria bacterium]|nr:fused response regulator/phosphatase [Gammaproteobacteria bacterium]